MRRACIFHSTFSIIACVRAIVYSNFCIFFCVCWNNQKIQLRVSRCSYIWLCENVCIRHTYKNCIDGEGPLQNEHKHTRLCNRWWYTNRMVTRDALFNCIITIIIVIGLSEFVFRMHFYNQLFFTMAQSRGGIDATNIHLMQEWNGREYLFCRFVSIQMQKFAKLSIQLCPKQK